MATVIPLSSAGQLFPECPISEISDLVDEARRLASFSPEILLMIDADRDRAAAAKAEVRRRDLEWVRTRGCKPMFKECEFEREEKALGQGPVRFSAETVLLLVLLRGWFGGFKSQTLRVILRESTTLLQIARSEGRDCFHPSTCIDAVNPLSSETLGKIHKVQLAMAGSEDMDDYSVALADSTAATADSQFPTDSLLLSNLVSRIFHAFDLMEKHAGVTITLGTRVLSWKDQAIKNAKEIALLPPTRKGARKTRKKLYRRLLETCNKLLVYSQKASSRLETKVDLNSWPPSKAAKIEIIQIGLLDDLERLQTCIEVTRRRVIEGEKVPASDKIFSLSDGGAWMIVKGQRVPVVGYKPQLATSLKSGLVTALILDKGNAKDSTMTVRLLKEHLEMTGAEGVSCSFDSGYASNKTIKECRELENVATVSIAGSTARKTLGDELYDSPEYQNLRKKRSRIEGTIGHLKQSHGFGRCSRRGLEEVRCEMLEKILSFNARRMTLLRSRKDEALAA